MARPKRSSPVLTNAEQRQAGLRSISDTLDLGNGLDLTRYTQRIETLRQKVSTYNTNIASIDDLSREIKALEKDLREASEQMLLGVGAVYGKDSREYGKAGGVRRSERKRSPKMKKTTTSSATSTNSEPTHASKPLVTDLSTLPLNVQTPEPASQSINGSINGSTNGKVLISQT
jgi:hypothetical protein